VINSNGGLVSSSRDLSTKKAKKVLFSIKAYTSMAITRLFFKRGKNT